MEWQTQRIFHSFLVQYDYHTIVSKSYCTEILMLRYTYDVSGGVDMSIKNIKTQSLDIILETMISTVGESKDEVFEIEEQCRRDFEALTKELEDIRVRVAFVITENDLLDKKARLARKRL